MAACLLLSPLSHRTPIGGLGLLCKLGKINGRAAVGHIFQMHFRTGIYEAVDCTEQFVQLYRNL